MVRTGLDGAIAYSKIAFSIPILKKYQVILLIDKWYKPKFITENS
ncbi:hypothetical protein ACEYW6_31785 [Nostoc sp. UIC 10607]